jgi:hypothetical protein
MLTATRFLAPENLNLAGQIEGAFARSVADAGKRNHAFADCLKLSGA